MSVLLTVEEFVSDAYMGSSGTKPASAVQLAIDIAEGNVSDVLGYPVEETGGPTFLQRQWVEQQRWPYPNRPLRLARPRLITLDEVLGLHDFQTCDCEWLELTACGFIYDELQSLVRFRTCDVASQCWSRCSCPSRVQVTYTAGFSAALVLPTTPLGKTLRLAIALTARELLELNDFWTEGVAPIKSYSELGYSESRDLHRTALGKRLGKGWLSEHAANLLEKLVVRKRAAIVLRSR